MRDERGLPSRGRAADGMWPVDAFQRVDRIAEQIIEALRATAPERGWRQGKRVALYDLRGVVPEIPGLGFAFVFPMRRFTFGLLSQPPGARFTHLIGAFSLLSDRLNMALAESQTLMQHEVAHILGGHTVNTAELPRHEYINHWSEMEANWYQVIADAERRLREDGTPDPSSVWSTREATLMYLERMSMTYRILARELTPENLWRFNQALDDYRLDRVRRLELDAGVACVAGPGRR